MSCACQEGAEGRYLIALADPFSNKAGGAQVPDVYSFPTATTQVKETFTISVQPNQTDVDFVVQPSLFTTIAYSDFATCAGGFVNYSSILRNASGTGFTENSIVSQATISGKFSRYRIVGGGVKIKVLTPTLTQQGQLFCCLVPSLTHSAWFPMESIANAVQNGFPISTNQGLANWNDYLTYYELPGVDGLGLISTQIQGMPLAHTNMLSGTTLEGGIEIAFKNASPDSLKFRDASPVTALTSALGQYGGFEAGQGSGVANYQYGSGVNQGGQVFTTSFIGSGTTGPVNVPSLLVAGETATPLAPGEVQYVGIATGSTLSSQTYTPIANPMDEDFLHTGGWSALCFRATGLSTSTTATATFSVEVCFHLEGVPSIPATANLYGQVQSFNASYPPVNPHAMHAAHHIAGHLPVFKKPGKVSAHVHNMAEHLMRAVGRHTGHHHGHHDGHGRHHHHHGSPSLTLKSLFNPQNVEMAGVAAAMLL